jgi:hypothetical protein
VPYLYDRLTRSLPDASPRPVDTLYLELEEPHERTVALYRQHLNGLPGAKEIAGSRWPAWHKSQRGKTPSTKVVGIGRAFREVVAKSVSRNARDYFRPCHIPANEIHRAFDPYSQFAVGGMKRFLRARLLNSNHISCSPGSPLQMFSAMSAAAYL